MANEKTIYSIIDVETTGGYRDGNKITEIAIINFDGEKILEEYSTLLNPERSIPYMITKLTGINNEMVADSPKFFEVAKKIVEMTENTVFVAHNVFFDYNFIQREFSELGFTYKRPKLCTVKMARKALPGHKSYSLGKVCKDLGISIENRHRALGDCRATVELLKRIMASDHKAVESFVEKRGNRMALPQGLDHSVIDDLPETAGVYYFFGRDNSLLYVGKSKNIRKRIMSHFRVDVKNKRDLQLKGQVERIDYTETGNELAALLLECHEIKNKRPFYNRALRFKRYKTSLNIIEKKSGEKEICVSHVSHKDDFEEHTYLFSNRKKAMSLMNYFYRAIIGCDKDSMEFEKRKDKLIETLGVEKYNEMLEKTFLSKITKESDFTLNYQGRNRDEDCLIEVENRYPVRLKYIKNDQEDAEATVIRLAKDEESKKILFNHLNS